MGIAIRANEAFDIGIIARDLMHEVAKNAETHHDFKWRLRLRAHPKKERQQK
jgi:hypothetical protein